MTPRLLLVVLEGADAALVSPLVDARAMPTLARILALGAFGPLQASRPLVRAMTYTTLATGLDAPLHGVCGDIEVRDDGAGTRPTSRASWTRPALWERLDAAGHAPVVVGWPATAPATSWPGTLLDDAYAEPFGPGYDAWPLLPDCVTPPSLRNDLRPLRVHPGDITAEQILTLVPNAGRVDQERDPRLGRLALLLARSSTVHAAATHLVTQPDWRFMAVAYPLLADGAREFARYRAPRPDDVDAGDVAIYGEVVDHLHRLQDAMLGRLLSLAGDDVTVVVVSPYAVATGTDRPDAEAASRLPPALAWHRPRGFVAASGPGIRRDALVHGMHVRDVAPTVLHVCGVRHDGLDGRVAAGLLDTGEASEAAQQSPGAEPPSPGFDIDAVTTIADDVDADRRDALVRVRTAWLANAAEAHLARGDVVAAARRYASIVDAHPDDWLACARLARCRLHLREFAESARLADRVIVLQPDRPWGYLLAAASRLLEGDRETARSHLITARATGRNLPQVTLRLATLHLLAGDAKAAELLFRESLQRLPASAEAFDGLGCALHAQGRHVEAIDAFRAALGCDYGYAIAHLHLAHALAALGRHGEAAEAARIAHTHDPRLSELPIVDAANGD